MVGPDSDGIPRAPPYSGVYLRRTFPFAYGTFTPCGLLSQHSSARKCLCNSAGDLQISARKTHNTPCTTTAALHASGLGWTPFAHHYSGHLFRFLFLRLLRCFTSPGCPRIKAVTGLLPQGFPIRISTDRWMLAPPRGFSQLAASFVGIWRQRHPPRALNTLTSYIPYNSLTIYSRFLSIIKKQINTFMPLLFYNKKKVKTRDCHGAGKWWR